MCSAPGLQMYLSLSQGVGDRSEAPVQAGTSAPSPEGLAFVLADGAGGEGMGIPRFPSSCQMQPGCTTVCSRARACVHGYLRAASCNFTGCLALR